MRKRTYILPAFAMAITAALSGAQEASALNYPTPLSLPDKYVGDTAIYYSDATSLLPNVLFVVDTSAAMGQPGKSEAYDPNISYAGSYSPNSVYSRSTATGGTVTYVGYGTLDVTLASGTNSISCAVARNSLLLAGAYPGKLHKDGTCNKPQDGDYYRGNYLNYMFASMNPWQAGTVYTKGAVVPDNDADARKEYTWTCDVAGTSGAVNLFPTSLPTDAAGNPNYNYTVYDGTAQWKLSSAIIDVARKALTQVMQVPDIRAKMRAGLMVMGSNNTGGVIKQNVAGISTVATQTEDGPANYAALMTAIGNLTPQNLLGSSSQNVNEMLWDADLYFRRPGGAGTDANEYNNSSIRLSTDTNASQSAKSPIQQPCQHNYVVVITQGNANATAKTKLIGDRTGDGTTLAYCGNDGGAGCVDDAADLLHKTDHFGTGSDGTTSVETIVIQLMSPRDGRLILTAAFGNGKTKTIEWATTADVGLLPQGDIYYYLASSADKLATVLLDALLNIGKQSQTSFVAPVVPVSPENRTYSGNRVYMGFFRPMKDSKPWRGNLKKYAMDAKGDIVDRLGHKATYVDMNGDGRDDRPPDYVTLPAGKRNGDFRPDSVSFWTFEDPSSLKCMTDDINVAVGRPLDATGLGELEGQCLGGQCGDGGIVDCGGVGEKLKTRSIRTLSPPDLARRRIYTFLPGDMVPAGYTQNNPTYLWTTDAKVNAICNVAICGFDNGALTYRHYNILTPADGYATTSEEWAFFGSNAPDFSRNAVIGFTHGIDAYDNDDGDGNDTENRFWMLGDVLHSRPQVVGYSKYTMSEEADCAKNKTMIYVGANDGMLHAFRDCNGEEAWAFVPTNLLGNLRQLQARLHVNFADSSAQAYVFDNNGNGNIEPAGPEYDKVYLVFGERRGGGQNAWEAKGYYIILEVSNPENPRFIRQFDYGAGTATGELAETWSEPRLAKIKIGADVVIAAFVGGGYDNCNEDSRYGNNQNFIGACATTSTPDSGLAVSGGAKIDLPQVAGDPPQKGRGVFVFRLAKLNASGVPNRIDYEAFTWPEGTINPIWKRTRADDVNMKYSFPGEMALVDTDFDGDVDKIYAGATGGNLWRFDLDTSPVDLNATSTLKGTLIFKSNPGTDTSVGRKIFYKPAVTLETGATMIFFGTGDREHPLNRQVVDRMYAFKDKDDPNGTRYVTGPKTEADLVDVTTDLLQTCGDAAACETAERTILPDLANKDGWYIKLDGGDRNETMPGEKVLASPSGFNNVAYFTTFTPFVDLNNPCNPAIQGTGRVYAVDYLTGEAVVNYNTGNDNNTTYGTRSTNADGKVLLRTDRVQTVGEGIPSGLTPTIQPDGTIRPLVGCGGGICTPEAGTGKAIYPLYWRQK